MLDLSRYIHHRSLADDGHMDANFGIGFYFFDRVFRTFADRHQPLNRRCFRVARRQLRLLQDTEDFPPIPSGFRL